MAIEARNRTLPDWFTRVRTRQIALPRFQRYQAWNHGDVALLFNTIRAISLWVQPWRWISGTTPRSSVARSRERRTTVSGSQRISWTASRDSFARGTLLTAQS